MRTTTLAPLNQIPGPSPVPLLGWLPHLVPLAFRPLSTLERLRKKYGNLIKFGYHEHAAIIVFDPAYNRQVLRDPADFYSYELELSPLPFPKDNSVSRLITGMPFTNGPRHDGQRAHMLPFFHRKFIKRYHEACVQVTERKAASWRIGQPIDLRREMEQLAIWLAASPILGLDPQGDGEYIGRQLEETTRMLYSPFTLLLPYDLPGFPYRRLLRSAAQMERVTREIIARKRAAGLTGDDILSAMIQFHDQDPESFSERDLLGNTLTMFRGGYNPNGMALYWTIFLLSQHPGILRRLLDEFDQVLDGRSPMVEELDRLVFLECVIKETMRLFPAGTWTARRSMQPFEMDGHQLPAGTWIVMSPYITHRMPEVFPDPYEFRPDRWLSIHPSAYEFMPFSAGPRYCLGASLAMLQLKTALPILLQRYALTLQRHARVDVIGLNSIRPRNGLPMIVHRRGEEPAPRSFQGNVRALVLFA